MVLLLCTFSGLQGDSQSMLGAPVLIEYPGLNKMVSIHLHALATGVWPWYGYICNCFKPLNAHNFVQKCVFLSFLLQLR